MDSDPREEPMGEAERTALVRAHGEAETQNEKVARVRGTIQDITGRKRREKDLRAAKAEAEENEELFRSVMKNAPVLIDIIDREGRIETVSDHFETVLGWIQEDLENEDASRLWELFFPDPERRQEALKMIQNAPDEWQDYARRPKAESG